MISNSRKDYVMVMLDISRGTDGGGSDGGVVVMEGGVAGYGSSGGERRIS